MADTQETQEAPRALKDLKPGTALEGVVTRIELYGAFVDVGLDHEGLVHISNLKRSHVNRVEDVVQPGQQVQVWVDKVDPSSGRLALTMVRPIALKWRDIKPGFKTRGKVVRLEHFGAFVDIGAERPGLVHVSEMSDEYVKDPSELVQVGEEVEVSVIDVDRKKRQIRLSMKGQESYAIPEDDNHNEPLPTAMEIALRQALELAEQEDGSAAQGGDSGLSEKERAEQEKILQRTLEQRVQTSTESSS